MDIKKAVREYQQKGWPAVLPVPSGQKFPPPTQTTGSYPPVTPEKIEQLWDEADPDSNLALRMQTDTSQYGIIAFDVDHYDDKKGMRYLKVLEKNLGSLQLERMVRSTGRGPDNPSGQYFFRVDPKVRFSGKLTYDVDIVQMTNRYSVVWPSVVGDRHYKWLNHDGEEVPIPAVDDLPWLSGKWQSYIRKGPLKFAGEEHRVQAEAAWEWLRSLDAWNEESAESTLVYLDEKLAHISSGSHDVILDAVNYVVRAATEGTPGLKKPLAIILKAFLVEHEEREPRRLSEAGAKAEFMRVLLSVVSDVQREVKEGHRQIRPIINTEELANIQININLGGNNE